MVSTETASSPTQPEGPNVTDAAIYLDGMPFDTFAAMRATPGLVWHPYVDGGFWAATRHSDVQQISRDSETFSSAIGHTNLWDLEADALEARRSLIDTDAPDHTRLRRLIARSFTPKNVKRWEDTVRAITAELLDTYVENGGGDWVEEVAAPLPIRVILTMLGVPVEDADYLVELSNYLVEGTGEEQSIPPDAFGNTTELRLLPFNSPASHALFEYGEALANKRRAEPQDDLVTMLVQAEAEDGDRLTGSEYKNLFHLLVFAGNETTRTAISQGAIALADNPDQWQRIVEARAQGDDALMESATEEILRWSTPVMHMRRTTTCETEVGGTTLAAGEKVVMWYGAANHDETVFENPFRFDVGRTDNPHFAFGGGGHHLCLGAFLARLEIAILLEEMADRSMTLVRAGEPVRTPSNFVHGILSVPMTVETSR